MNPAALTSIAVQGANPVGRYSSVSWDVLDTQLTSSIQINQIEERADQDL